MDGENERALAAVEKSTQLIEEAGCRPPRSGPLLSGAALFRCGTNSGARSTGSRHGSGHRLGARRLDLCRLTEAHAALSRHDRPTGHRALREALAVGREKNYATLCYFWLPELLAGLCGEALEEGIEVEYVRGLIRRLDLKPIPSRVTTELWPWPFELATLGGFKLIRGGQLFSFSGKAQKKPLDLLKAIVAAGTTEVDEHWLSEALWPEADGDLARRSLDTTLHRLRKLLGNDRAVRFSEGKLSLDPLLWRIDARTFEKLFTRLEHLLGGQLGDAGQPPARFDEIAGLFDKAQRLYCGHFLAAETGAGWSISLRERLRSKFIRLVGMAAVYRERAGDWQAAEGYYLKGLDVDGLVEEFYRGLMLCCRELGQYAEAVNAYSRCREVLAGTLGVAPSPQTEALYRTLSRRQ